MKIEKYLLQAVRRAMTGHKRKGFHAAVGIRADGAIIYSRNNRQYVPTPSAHAEARLCRRLGRNAPLVIVVRIDKSGEWAMSKPCPGCEALLRRAKVKKVIWTSSARQYKQLSLV